MGEVSMRENITPLRDTFNAATVGEMRKHSAGRRIAALVDQRLLFPHSGALTLTREALQLGDWRTIRPGDVIDVTKDYIPEYGRFAAGGARGGFPSFGGIKRFGAPFVLDLTSGERIVLLIGFTWWSGSSNDARWQDALTSFTRQTP